MTDPHAGYYWWTFMYGNSAVHGRYLKLGPFTICRWTSIHEHYVDFCFLDRWIKTVKL